MSDSQTGNALIREMYREPHEANATRLIYADWLEEQGQNQAAQLMRMGAADPMPLPFNVMNLFLPHIAPTEMPWRPNVTALRFRDGYIGYGDDGLAKVQALAAGLPAELAVLNLGINCIGHGDNGLAKMQALAAGLPASLVALDLGINSIGHGNNGLAKMQALAARLPAGLAVLDLGRNSIGYGDSGLEEVQALAAGLPASLVALDLGNNHIGYGKNAVAHCRAIAEAPCINLHSIDLGSHMDAQGFFTALRQAYKGTIRDGSKPSLFHLEAVAEESVACELPPDLAALRQRAQESWEKAHAAGVRANIRSGRY